MEHAAEQLAHTAWPLGERDDKLIIYQLLPRLFGNAQTATTLHGSLEENGVGKLNDITDEALLSLRRMGITHLWYTGVIEHASMTSYQHHGIAPDHPAVVKGRAGSPYAIKDYYDISPDLAVDVERRMDEFLALVDRTHRMGMNVLIDFVPNHVARSYASDQRPAGTEDLGARDLTHEAFHPNNNFYYLPGQAFTPPAGYVPFGPENPLNDQLPPYREEPARATGNDVFSASPSVHDWFETVKLNYGVDVQGDHATHFDPIPDTWQKMYDILVFWADKGVDGFRCDMAHMVPVAFWGWVIPKVKMRFPSLVFIAEIYEPAIYQRYIFEGKFDYLYDKVGVYDHLRKVMNVQESTRNLWHALNHAEGIAGHMLRFLENHDEQRLASPQFAGNPQKGIPAMAVSACLSTGPVMVYFGQEVGEPAAGASGFSGDDGRTTLFDYWHVPEHQKWMNGGKFDGGQLSEAQRKLRQFYAKLLNLCRSQPALRTGQFYALPLPKLEEIHTHMIYAFLRHCEEQQLLILANFNPERDIEVPIYLPAHAWETMGMDAFQPYRLKERLHGQAELPLTGDTRVHMPSLSAFVFELLPAPETP